MMFDGKTSQSTTELNIKKLNKVYKNQGITKNKSIKQILPDVNDPETVKRAQTSLNSKVQMSFSPRHQQIKLSTKNQQEFQAINHFSDEPNAVKDTQQEPKMVQLNIALVSDRQTKKRANLLNFVSLLDKKKIEKLK